jgi:hypothetical protein
LASSDHPITIPPGRGRVGLDQPQPTRFLHPGRWQATCGDVLMEGRTQARVEPNAARTSCPVWVEVAA